MTTLLNGVLGGLLAGLLAAIAIQRFAADPSATAVLTRRLWGGGSSSRWREASVQVLYGALAGGLLVALELYVLGVLAVPPTVVEAFGTALAWSGLLLVSLLVVGRAGSPALHSRTDQLELATYHLVYGLGLGLWIRMTWIT